MPIRDLPPKTGDRKTWMRWLKPLLTWDKPPINGTSTWLRLIWDRLLSNGTISRWKLLTWDKFRLIRMISWWPMLTWEKCQSIGMTMRQLPRSRNSMVETCLLGMISSWVWLANSTITRCLRTGTILKMWASNSTKESWVLTPMYPDN